MPAYTPEQLRQHVRSQGLDVSLRQIEEWNKAGFLPTPSREKLPGQGRGRAPYQYPDPAPDVVVWLSTHRRSISGDDTTKFWLWLERYDHIQIDPILFLLVQITIAWDDLHAAIPSLPDITHTVEHGLSDDQMDRILEEWDAAITAPALASGELDERTAPQVFLDALMYGVVPPAWIDPAYKDMLALPNAMYDAPLPDALAAKVAEHLPYMVRAASLVTLYRRLFAEAEWERVREVLITHYHELAHEVTEQLSARYNQLLAAAVGPSWLRMWWRFLTPEIIATYWRGGAGGVPRLRSRGELLRYWKYDPLQFAMFAANVEDTLKRGVGPFRYIPLLPQASQPPHDAHTAEEAEEVTPAT
jgi:hypothetical protein